MAHQGFQALGIDFVASAIAKAKEKARLAGAAALTQFYVGDVTRLPALKLPRCSFALDMGCFHGLSPDGRRSYVDGLAAQIVPGGQFLMLALKPRKEMGVAFGLTAEQVKADFTPVFEIQRVQPTDMWDQGSSWFWMKRNENSVPLAG